MFKKIKVGKASILKALSIQIQVLCFFLVVGSIGYIFINFNSINPVLPGAETSDIAQNANKTVVQVQNFSDNVPVITPDKYKSGIETTTRANYIKIDRILIDGNIIDGAASDQNNLLAQGFWRFPDSKTPDQIGTMTVFGHRRAHLPPAKDTFYNLDKVKLGDLIEAGYNGKIYYYKVISTKVVEPNDWNAIKDETFKSIKLITCTPLGTSNQRIVITAEQI